MSKRKSLSRRSSKSSRYTGSAVLDPDTDVTDSGAHPYWWKNLENNTIGRPSIDFNMVNETSRQLDSNSQIASNEAENEWWKVLDTSDSSEVVKPQTKQAKSVLSTSESEEEPRIIKRKLPLRSRTKTHQDNAFLNALNESKETSFSEPIPTKNSSLNKPKTPNKAFSDNEQLVGASDSSLDLSLSSNDILKSKPKIFKHNYKNRDENVFVDVLQSNEFKVPFKKKPVCVTSPKITEQKDSSKVEAPLYNRSRSMEYTLSFEGSRDLSHLPAPKAQSTTLEDSTPYNSNKSDSISDIDHKIVKPKPKLLQCRNRRVKKNVFQDIFENENTDDETEKSKSISKNVVENIEISKRSLRSSSNKLLKPSQEPPKDIANEENNETEESKVSRARTKRQSAIIATKNIKRSSERDKNDSLDKSLNISTPSVDIPIQPDVSVKSQRRITNVQSENSNSPKRKSSKKKSVLSQNLIRDENNEHMSSPDQADVIQLPEEVPNKLQRRSTANISSSSNKQERKNTESQGRVSSRTRSSVLSMKESTQTNTNVSYVDNIRESDEKASKDADNNGVLNKLQYIDEERENISRRSTANILSSSNRIKERRNTENLSKVSSRAANLASSVNKIIDMYPSTSDTDDENKSDIEEEPLYDPTNEETSNKLKYADQDRKNTSAGSTINKTSRSSRIERRNTENRSRVSNRRSNLVLSTKEMTRSSMRVSNAGDKGIRETEDEDSTTSVNDEEAPNTQYTDKEQKNASQRSAINKSLRSSRIERRNTENRNRVSSRRSNLMLSTKEMIQSNIRVSNAGDKGLRKKMMDEDSTDVNDEEAPNTQYADKEQINISEVSTINNLSGNRKVHKDGESRASNLDVDTSSDDSTIVEQQEDIFERRSVASISDVDNEDGNDTVNNLAPIAKGVNRMSRNTDNTSNVTDKEAEEGILHAYTPRKLHRPGRYTNMVQKMSTANVSPALNRKESVGVGSLGRLSNRTSNLLPPSVSSSTVQGTSKAKLQTTIRNFFSANRSPQVSGKQLFLDEQNGEKIRSELEMIKKREMDRMNAVAKKQTEVLSTIEKKMNKRTKLPKTIRNKRKTEHVHKAYLVNGQVYKVPRLPRPKAWVTDRLYKYLWKVMEPKYKLETRVMSEKFVRQLSEVTTSIAKQKSYNKYRGELYALMKEMARLGIIRTRNDFYNFCHDFFPYELRFKMVPMLLPGNNRNIPYDPNKLHEPILHQNR